MQYCSDTKGFEKARRNTLLERLFKKIHLICQNNLPTISVLLKNDGRIKVAVLSSQFFLSVQFVSFQNDYGFCNQEV